MFSGGIYCRLLFQSWHSLPRLHGRCGRRGWLGALIFFLLLVGIVFAMYSFIYYLNQRAVRVELEPRRHELLTLLASLGDETTSEVSGEYPILMSAKRVECSPRQTFVATLCLILFFVAVVSIALAVIYFVWAAQTRERKLQVQPTRSSVHKDDAEAPLTKLIVGLRKENDFVGLAAMVMVDGKVEASAADGERKEGERGVA